MFLRLLLILPLAAPGCLSRRTTDLLEARLRVQEDRLYELAAELQQAQAGMVSVQRENDALRRQLANRGHSPLAPEHAVSTFKVEGVRISKWTTGGLDRDGSSGDDLLNVVLIPHDAQGDVVKVPGRVDFELFDLKSQHGRRQLGAWSFDIDECRRFWHKGILTAGYQFELPWQELPTAAELLLHVRFTTADSRQFDASSNVRINPPGADGAASLASASGSKPIAKHRNRATHRSGEHRGFQQPARELPADFQKRLQRPVRPATGGKESAKQ